MSTTTGVAAAGSVPSWIAKAYTQMEWSAKTKLRSASGPPTPSSAKLRT